MSHFVPFDVQDGLRFSQLDKRRYDECIGNRSVRWRLICSHACGARKENPQECEYALQRSHDRPIRQNYAGHRKFEILNPSEISRTARREA